MTFARIVIALAFLLLASSAAANREIRLVCHVGNETGPGGVTYLDDPDCVPSNLNGYFCPDAGKIDLIVVAEKAADNHLENLSHYWDGISDYDPLVMGATGDGTEDSDGNGVDDGCEIPAECPCWAEAELQAVTATNVYAIISCDFWNGIYPIAAAILTNDPIGEQQGFASEALPSGQTDCGVLNENGGFDLVPITLSEHDICVSQIAEHCAQIGQPITSD